jgi:hypothetical protein
LLSCAWVGRIQVPRGDTGQELQHPAWTRPSPSAMT